MLTRGIKHEVDRFINDLQAQYYPHKLKGEDCLVQLGVRPIQLWEIVMPKDSLQDVMRTIWKNGIDKTTTKQQLVVSTLRKALGASKVPPLDLTKLPRPMHNTGFVACYPIGIKEDGCHKEFGHENL